MSNQMGRQYEFTYEEIDHYNSEASKQRAMVAAGAEPTIIKNLMPAIAASEQDILSFPEPRDVWIDATYDGAAQYDSYAYIAPIAGKRLLQLGGSGLHAIKAIQAGAREAWLVTPVRDEARLALAVARRLGLHDRLTCVVALGEELPFATGSFDAILSGGCLHHMQTERAIPECARILSADGRFAAWDPWRSPLYGIGTRVFGKREVEVNCKPITADRARPLQEAFDTATVVHHGALTRYFLIALGKLRIQLNEPTVSFITKIDDVISAWLPGLRRTGSSVALLGGGPLN
jgi:SAM-dependent methyltransferase